MKKIISYSAILCISLIACNQKQASDANIAKYEKNLEIAKQFYAAFTSKDSTKQATFLTDDFKWNGPAIGQDSLSKEVLMAGDKEFMKAFNDIKFENTEYVPGIDPKTYALDGGVRVYGTINSKFASSGKTSKVKYYAVLGFNDSGKITTLEEYYNMEDLSKEF